MAHAITDVPRTEVLLPEVIPQQDKHASHNVMQQAIIHGSVVLVVGIVMIAEQPPQMLDRQPMQLPVQSIAQQMEHHEQHGAAIVLKEL